MSSPTLEELAESRVAVVFTGQGSQYYGMFLPFTAQPEKYFVFNQFLKDIDEQLKSSMDGSSISGIASPSFEEVIELAQKRKIGQVWDEKDNFLKKTRFTQPAVVVYEIAALKELMQMIYRKTDAVFKPVAVAGHSLGEIAAYYAAGVLNAEQAVFLANQRGIEMGACPPKKEPPEGESYMAALTGFDHSRREEFENIVPAFCSQKKSGKTLVHIANDNTSNQAVISGDWMPVKNLSAVAVAQGYAKKAVFLFVEKPYHTRYMDSAQQQLESFTSRIVFSNPSLPIVANYDVSVPKTGEQVRTAFLNAITGRVRWREIIDYVLKEIRPDFILEIGPMPHLTGMFKSDPLKREHRNKAVFAGDYFTAS